MNKMKLVSSYSDYGNPDMWDKNSSVKCVCDEQIYVNKREGKQVLLLIEPRSIQPSVYDYVIKVASEYEYVFTHDSYLLKALPNAKPILWGGVWCRIPENTKGINGIDYLDYDKLEKDLKDSINGVTKPLKKTKLISMICSDKELCELHKERKRIARKYKDKIDVYGTIDGGEYVKPIETLRDYKYSVVIENYIDDIWFTEKICNCFATKTIPIYYGARNIDDYFNDRGIIICDSLDEIEEQINFLINDEYYANSKYESYKPYIDQNYELSKQFEKFDEWLYKTYEKEIGELFES